VRGGERLQFFIAVRCVASRCESGLRVLRWEQPRGLCSRSYVCLHRCETTQSAGKHEGRAFVKQGEARPEARSPIAGSPSDTADGFAAGVRNEPRQQRQERRWWAI